MQKVKEKFSYMGRPFHPSLMWSLALTLRVFNHYLSRMLINADKQEDFKSKRKYVYFIIDLQNKSSSIPMCFNYIVIIDTSKKIIGQL